ncbi:MAG TPA: L,D-transpeptidase family protein [Phototrophicaceae bacterium]|nr:L,D-transpeptidase family protein [Phototrophicaceae bacterium]
MEVYQPERRSPRGQARERYAARQRKQMVTRHTDDPVVGEELVVERPVMSRAPTDPGRVNREVLKGRAVVASRDVLWYLKHNPLILIAIISVCVVLVGAYLGTHVFGDRVFPNVWALNVNIGDMTVEQAEQALQNKWTNGTQIQLHDGDRVWAATPAQMGLSLDAAATVAEARSVGLAGVPLGYGVMPVVNMDTITTQNFLLDLTEQTKILPYDPGFKWQGNDLVGIPGTDGRYLDVATTMSNLQGNLALVASSGRIDLAMTTVPPDARDPGPYLAQAKAFTSQNFVLKGYDPFTDEHFAWTTDRDTLTSWLEVDKNGLDVRQDTFAAFVNAQTTSLVKTNAQRYIEVNDSIQKMQDAIKNTASEVDLRVRYHATTYTVQPGDSGYVISHEVGIPFYQIQLANPGRDWDQPLNVGDIVNLPSPDITIPVDPLPNKRIVVNLKTQSMVAYEDGKPVFSWLISSGMDTDPTNPGIYEILDHEPIAKGGSSDLCSSLGCAQWTMYWFMGIYEAVPGLMNGFHGAVLLANGRYLGDGLTGAPFTYGCIMSDNDNGEKLYNWADVGTVVEIISPTFQPKSALGKQMLAESPATAAALKAHNS